MLGHVSVQHLISFNGHYLGATVKEKSFGDTEVGINGSLQDDIDEH